MRNACFLVALVCFIAGTGFAAELVLVREGKPNAVIIVPPEPAQPEAPATKKAKTAPPKKSKWLRAAEAIQQYIEKMSDARLPIVEEDSPIEGKPEVRILVGSTKAAKSHGIQIPHGYNTAIRPDYGEEEGYVLKRIKNDLIVAGNNDGPYAGTLYAAYALLERLGCRFYFPGDFGEVVPRLATIGVPDLDERAKPDFAIRSIWLSGWVPVSCEESAAYSEWCFKAGFNPNRGLYPGAGDGSLAGLLPASEFAAEHPEYYAMNKAGQRNVTPNRAQHSTMLCLSNPDVLATAIANLKAAYAGERKMPMAGPRGFGISPPDGAPFCYCPACMKASQNFNYPTYVHERMQSEEFFGFASALARAFPDKWVSTMAYSLRETPPQGISLPPNVAVTIAPISCCVLHPLNHPGCWRRLEHFQMLKQWRRQTPHVMIYDYNPGMLLGMWIPERDVANFAINAPLYQEIGIKGIAAEGRKAFMQTWISYYVRARLLWNAATDVAALKKEFYETFFGTAAGPHVQAWWDACEDALPTSTAHVHEDWLVNHIYTVDFVSGLRRHVDAALKAATTPEHKARVEAFALIADHLEAYAKMYDAQRRLDFAGAAKACERMTECKQQLHAINSFFISVRPGPQFAEGHKVTFEKLASCRDGTRGENVADLPLQMAFTRDRFNEGVLAEWYAPDYDDSGWGLKDTFLTWDQQDKPEDEKGHDYDGYGWYRAEFNVDKRFAGKPMRLYLGGAINEIWVWINGQYVGHGKHQIWWQATSREFDVAAQVKPGQKNTIAIRLLNNAEVGGLRGRGFIWSPTPAQLETEKKEAEEKARKAEEQKQQAAEKQKQLEERKQREAEKKAAKNDRIL